MNREPNKSPNSMPGLPGRSSFLLFGRIMAIAIALLMIMVLWPSPSIGQGVTDEMADIPRPTESTTLDGTQRITTPANRGNRCGDGFCVGSEDFNGCPVDCPGVSGVCGPAHGQNIDSYPVSNQACASGVESALDAVGSDGTFDWSCAGLSGGATSTCFAVRNRDGICGDANGGAAVFPAPGGSSACAFGTLAFGDSTGNDGTYNWTCAGTGNGATVSCAAPRMPSEDGACGVGAGTSTQPQPSGAAACGAGTFEDLADTATEYRWRCNGDFSGSSPTCTATIAPPLNGNCGPAQATAQATHPSGAAACTAGSYSEEADTSGQWRWSCAGVYGGSNQSCYANRPINASCGAAHTTNQGAHPSGAAACGTGSYTEVGDTAGQWRWSCSGINGGSNQSCYANQPISGACGASNGTNQAAQPAGADACSQGTLIDAADSEALWNWSCSGTNGGASAACSANKPLTGLCGAAHTTDTNAQPAGAAACTRGSFVEVADSGTRWNWSCSGVNGGADSVCYSNKASPPQNGACGSGDGGTSASQPSGVAACSAGTFTDQADTASDWRWSCTGNNGGTTAVCTANKIEGACGSGDSAQLLGEPKGSLACSSGTYSDQPDTATTFNWNCGSATCSADRLVDRITGASYSGFHFLRPNGDVWGFGTACVSPRLGCAFEGDPVGRLEDVVNMVQIDSGSEHLCGVKPSNRIFCRGSNTAGQLGRGSVSNEAFTAAVVPGLPNSMIQVSLAGAHTVALSSAGRVYTWGDNSFGNCGTSDGANAISSPYLLPFPTGVVEVLATQYGGLARTSGGQIWVWGGFDPDFSAPGFAKPKATPRLLLTDPLIVRMSAEMGGDIFVPVSRVHLFRGDGTVLYAVEPDTGNLPVPFQTDGLLVDDAEATTEYVIKLPDGTTRAKGSGLNGQLGNGSNADSATPVAPIGMTGVRSVSSSLLVTCAEKLDDSIWCWGGQNEWGGTYPDSNSPVRVPIP